MLEKDCGILRSGGVSFRNVSFEDMDEFCF